MKNLKRALSLVLSTAMLAGMMMVGTGAAFDDVTAEHNEEAIAVVSAAGIMGANEEFNPDAKITRNEMAVVMCNMLGLDTEDYTGASAFTDVPAWAKGYVDACFANGIVSGVSATQYNGGANVTTGEAALMMMKALGYFQYPGDFQGDWLLATVKQASKIDLLDDIDAGAKTAMTRNEVAQLALNALESFVVDTNGIGQTTNITTSDVQISVSGEASYYNVTDKKDYNYNYSTDIVEIEDLYLIEKLYEEDYKKAPTTTALGQPANEWEDWTQQKSDDRSIIKVADDAKFTVVVEEAMKDTLAVYKEYIDEDVKSGDIYDSEIVVDYALNGVVAEGTDHDYVAGDVVEFYMNKYGKITDVATMRYSFGEIEKIDTKTLTKAQKEDGATAKITIEGEMAVLDNKFAGFDYEKGDKILYILKADKTEVLDSALAETIEGKVTSLKGSTTVKATINGEAIVDLNKITEIGDEGTFFLNKAGQIIAAESTSASEDYLYIYDMDVDTTGRNTDGVQTAVATAYTVDAEGTKAKYDVAVDYVKAAEQTELKREPGVYFADTDIALTDGFERAIAYSINSDDQLVYETAKHSIKLEEKLINKDVAAGTNGATEFIFANTSGSTVKVSTATGYKNVNIFAVEGEEIVAKNVWTVTDTNDDDKILYVFIEGKNGSVTTDANLAVVLDASPARGENEDGDKTYTYTVAIDGVESALTFKAAQGFDDGDVIAYEFDGNWAVIDEENEDKVFTEDKVTSATEDYIVLNGKQYNLTGDETIYTIVKSYEEDGVDENNNILYVLDTVTVGEGGEVEKDDYVVYTVDDDVIDTLFVYEYAY